MNSEESDATHLAERFIQLTRENIFLTGKAGTGKTTFLKKIKSGTLKKTLVTAPTGIAALNAGGVTLHSQFQLPFGGFIPEHGELRVKEDIKFETLSTLIRHAHMGGQKTKAIREAELLIIDEVSMLRADLLDAINIMLQTVRRNRTPFGGIQVLFIGDMMQLPPVVKRSEWEVLRQYYKSPFFFDSWVLRDHPPLYIELEKIYRQADQKFTNILNRVRYNQLAEADIQILNSHYQPNFKPEAKEGYIRLTTHNRDADEINQIELHRLQTTLKTFDAEIEGEFPPNIFPCEAKLNLKIDAQVMFIKNDPTAEQRFYNGKIGRVKAFQEKSIEIEDQEGNVISVDPYIWQNIRYSVNEGSKEIEEEVIGTYQQFPLRLAWAITIHKSQGLTFEKAIIDIEKVFASGQAYVALSRLTGLEGLVLSSPMNAQGIPYDQSLARFEERKEIQGNTKTLLNKHSESYLRDFCLQTFDLNPIVSEWNHHIQSYNKEEGRSEKQNHLEWAKEIRAELIEISNISDRFKSQLIQLMELNDSIKLKERIHAAISYFNPIFQPLNEKVLKHKLQVSKLPKTKQYVSELDDLDSRLSKTILSFQKVGLLMESSINPELDIVSEWNTIGNLKWRNRIINEFAETNLPGLKIPKEFVSNKKYYSNSGQKTKEPRKTKKEKGQTYTLTLEAYTAGKTLEEIAEIRGLAVSTIVGHMRRLIVEERISIEKLISPEALQYWTEFLQADPDIYIWGLREKIGDENKFRELVYTKTWLEKDKSKVEEDSFESA